MSGFPLSIFWFRRDLRLHDNAGLHYALQADYPVLPLFIFDTDILENLEERQDARVQFILERIYAINQRLRKGGTSLLVKYGRPLAVFEELLQSFNIRSAYTNRDYEPYAINRDHEVHLLLKRRQIPFYSFKDQVIYEQDEITTREGQPYKVFTPYKKSWMQKFGEDSLETFPVELNSANWYKTTPFTLPTLDQMGFGKVNIPIPSSEINEELITRYHDTRNYPAMNGTSRLGIHLRFGSISIRELVRIAARANNTFLDELIWREFYMQILYHYPRVVNHAFKPQFDNIPWRNDSDSFAKWCEGMTGYPIVDAGMRQLNQTGYMPNRVRMITASFLTKHLLIDWRWGEAYFARKLLDYELASNNGGWQWAAGTGTDAQPYFRIFNPTTQSQKFDPHREYIKQWVPEIDSQIYPEPMVDHKMARERALAVYKKTLKE